MYLIPHGSERGLSTLQRQMNRLFDDFFGDESVPGIWNRSGWAPAMDVSENEDEFVVHVEVPGIAREDMDISVTGNMLTITGEKKSESEETEGNAHRSERAWGRFARSVSLPSAADAGDVKANLKDGILRIRLPKKEEAKPRAIEVQVD